MTKKTTSNLFTKALSEGVFDEYFNDIMKRTKDKLLIKGAEYCRNGDRMHNFNSASLKKQEIREKVLDGMRLKHEVSIDDMRNDISIGLLPSIATVEEKLGDRLIYDILEEISIRHRIDSADKSISDR